MLHKKQKKVLLSSCHDIVTPPTDHHDTSRASLFVLPRCRSTDDTNDADNGEANKNKCGLNRGCILNIHTSGIMHFIATTSVSVSPSFPHSIHRFVFLRLNDGCLHFNSNCLPGPARDGLIAPSPGPLNRYTFSS